MSEENNNDVAQAEDTIVYAEDAEEGKVTITTRAPKVGKACKHSLTIPKDIKGWLKTFGDETVEGWIVKSFKIDFQKAARIAMQTNQEDLLSTFSDFVAKGQVPSVSSKDPMTAMKREMASMSKEEAAQALKELQEFLAS